MIKVLLVDDSSVVLEFLADVLNRDPEFQIIGYARSGEEAIEFLQHNKPDIISMDIHMPGMNGIDATARIMETRPLPIVIVSASFDSTNVARSLECLRAGALYVTPLPRGRGHPDFETSANEFCQTLKLMAEVKVVKRWPRFRRASNRPSVSIPCCKADFDIKSKDHALIAIGASTGGPVVIQSILSALPKYCTIPIVIVQHMSDGFIHGFAEWLAHSTLNPIHVATHGEPLLPSHIYIAPNGFNMEISHERRIVLKQPKSRNEFCPLVGNLFRSVAEVFGSHAVGILLSGMGSDGAKELRLMREKGAITIVQDEKSSIIFGMPREAIKMGAADHQFSPEEISRWLAAFICRLTPYEGQGNPMTVHSGKEEGAGNDSLECDRRKN